MNHHLNQEAHMSAQQASAQNVANLATFDQSALEIALSQMGGISPEMQLKQFLHDTRKALNISQRELSKMSGVNQSNLSKIENGIINPSIATIQKVAACLGHKVELRFIPNYKE